MQKKNLVTLLGIALVVALVATGVFYGLFVSNLKSNAPERTLVVAAKPLEAGTVLSAADVKTIQWPAANIPKGAFEKPEQVKGKTLFDAVGEAEPLFASQLISKEGEGRSAGIPAGMRAVSVHVTDSSGILAMLHAGHKVDVQVVTKPGKDAGPIQLRTVLEQVEVLAVSPKPQQSSQGENLPVVTLLAKPADADLLALADAGARIRLTLRNPLDNATRPRTPVSLNAILQ
jgi:pilus assembly protein CpaB